MTNPNASEMTVYDDAKKQLLKDLYFKGSTDLEFSLFLANCQRSGLDPFATPRQIYALKRREYDAEKKEYVEKMSTQVGIDGYRLIADRTKEYMGQLGPYWCGKDGVWRDVWLDDAPPMAAKVGIVRDGFKDPVWAVAKYSEYVQTTRDGKPFSIWAKMPANQLSKCAEALALRKTFPKSFASLEPDEDLRPHVEIEPVTEPETKTLNAPQSITEPQLTEGRIVTVRPANPDAVRVMLSEWEHKHAHDTVISNGGLEKFRGLVVGKLAEFVGGEEPRHILVEELYHTAKGTSSTLTQANLSGLMEWMCLEKREEDGKRFYLATPDTALFKQEANAIIEYHRTDHGQGGLPF